MSPRPGPFGPPSAPDGPRGSAGPGRGPGSGGRGPAGGGRCVTRTTVRPAIRVSIAVITWSALAGSRCAVGSSSSSTGARRRNARARAIFCRCPADRLPARSVRTVSKPPGSRRMKSSAPASCAAAAISARCAAGWPRAMLPATVVANKCGCCGTQAIWASQPSPGIRARSVPPAVMVPLAGMTSPSSKASSELFPAPLGPVRMMCSPGRMVRSMSWSASRSRPG